MKRLIIKTFFTILAPVVVFTFVMLMCPDNLSKLTLEANVGLAYERLDSLKDVNKVVIISGSNGSFGIESKMLEDSLHLPVVNTSTHAGIGVRMQFEMYKDFLKRGDIVIFCPEYGSGDWRLYGESTLYRVLSTHLPKAYLKLSFRQWCSTFKYVGIHFWDAMDHRHYRYPFEGPYSSSSINRYGDIEYPREHQEVLNPSVVYFSNTMDEEATSYIKYVHDFAKSKGLILVYLPPALIESGYQSQKSQLCSLEQFMKDNNIPLQASPGRYAFPDTLFYDTPYHLTMYGAHLRTLKMLEDVKRVLAEKKDKDE